MRTIVENECRATRNLQLGLKGLVRDSLRFRVYGDTVKFAGNGALETLAGSLLRADIFGMWKKDNGGELTPPPSRQSYPTHRSR